MLQLLKETVSSRHAERLEQIVIALIVVEIGMFLPRTIISSRAHPLLLVLKSWVSLPLSSTFILDYTSP